jgi:epsin
MGQVDLLAKLAEATTNDSSFASISLLNEISSRTDNREDCDLVLRHCAKILTLKPKLWKKIQKGLSLIEHIIKTGSQDFIDKMKDEREKLKNLEDFSYEEDGIDRGNTIRNKAKYLVELLSDSFKLKEEKKKFSSWKSRIEGVASGGVTSSSYRKKKR